MFNVCVVYLRRFLVLVKGACSDPQPHPPTFFKHMEILVPKVELYLEGFMCEILCAKLV